ncbi:hypothetical protein COU62_03320 [Candidatus Pacearchaeota archaeon CG10_big_fil_rev_8_21_14_0_10_35_219]|nr:winged helix DNA-binding protein [Candidatus Pacearchaeota archaeon]OIO42379.1 MAG: hypothetical protein AUJ63_03840 [Candidatus Pacearchaeota archaeon CG1_02_35_32]PIO07384.1 MAG: hypothetical protein COU62_03320 [Candidatus Pacearchaeota archaeon CG10_big_fil_rev_8_21_14_0_10_35_219]PIY81687.1 MAG: hypothetical protein COY79_01270 [Candidatus Pacearchaeota archaeon CG_4_10_14_0_8_um_filter_35_169]PIZ79504.1 MAG: hypothetical protein COY00_03735 [Candidatus Pacearchaeota archaeon CG_4_10_14
MKKFVLLILMIFVIPNSLAYTSLNINLDDTGNALFLGQSDESAIEGLPSGINYDNEKLWGETMELTSKTEEIWNFSFSLTDSEMQVFLPEGARVLNTNGEISLSKDKIVIYGVGYVEVDYVIEASNIGDNSNLGLLVILTILVIVVVYLLVKEGHRTRKERTHKDEKNDKIKAVQGILNEREKWILEKLKETGKTKSSYLRRKTEIPKASFSRHIRELERKGLVKISGEGRNKFVEIDK